MAIIRDKIVKISVHESNWSMLFISFQAVKNSYINNYKQLKFFVKYMEPL